MRTRLPDRRFSITVTIEDASSGLWTVGCGFNERGRVGEIFIKPAREGGDVLAGFAYDSGVTVSMLLQCGVGLAEIARSLTPQRAPSLLSRAVHAALEIEREEGPRIAAAIAALAAAKPAEAPAPSGLVLGMPNESVVW